MTTADAEPRSSALVLPRYGEASLTDLLPSALGALGVAGEHDIVGLPPARGYCLLLVDGLGWNLLRAHSSHAPFLSSMSGRPITAGLPTTTATSLTSLGTGLPPGRHGVFGYATRIPGGTTLLNALKWDDSVDPIKYQPHPTVFERAVRAGVGVTVIGQRQFRESGLTRAGLRAGKAFRAAQSLGERVAAAASAAASSALVYVYEGDLDVTGHGSGCESAAWRHQLVMIDRFTEELYDALPAGTVLLVTADHGMVDVPPERRVDVDDVPALRDGVDIVGGEARFRHVYTRDGAAADVLAAWSEVLGDRALVRSRDQAIADGWFGAAERRVRDRIGDVVAALTGDCAVEVRSVFPVEAKMFGLHGGPTPDEMLIPLLTIEG